MALKHAVLGLLVERRGYGYELVQRFETRIGGGWQLKPSAIYTALDQLERAELVACVSQPGATRRSRRVVYSATQAGVATFDAWMRAEAAAVEPIRSDLHLRLALAGPAHRAPLLAQLAERERACRELLARHAEQAADSVALAPTPSAWAGAVRRLVDTAAIAHLRAELAWVAVARDTVAHGDEGGGARVRHVASCGR